jgi:hypothetical protein
MIRRHHTIFCRKLGGDGWINVNCGQGETHQQRPKLTALLRPIYRLPSGNSTNIVHGFGALDAGDQMDGSLRPTERLHRIRNRFQILHGVHFRQHERPDGGNGELRGGGYVRRSFRMSMGTGHKGRAYNADHVALEKRGVGAIYAHSDARRMGQFVCWRFLPRRSVTVVECIEDFSTTVKNSVSRSLATVLPSSEGATLSSRS